MSDDEHLVENIIDYVQRIGWAKLPNVHSKEWNELYAVFGKNGQIKVSEETFEYLLYMAEYVVYHSTVCNTDFSEVEK